MHLGFFGLNGSSEFDFYLNIYVKAATIPFDGVIGYPKTFESGDFDIERFFKLAAEGAATFPFYSTGVADTYVLDCAGGTVT